ncbi:MAG: hypothetical protein INQ03_24125 [Candidatus Heimdallarchaeota archaeon]|nr:hypothetical protein [Candidatus Heimdallarchaeota archaeon]
MIYNILYYLDLYATHIILGLFLRFVLQLVPESIRVAFDDSARFVRSFIIYVVEAIYNQEKNFEVFISSRIIVPFVIIVYVEGLLMLGIIWLAEYTAISLLIYIFFFFIIINIIPSKEEMEVFSDISPTTIFRFIVKLVIVLVFAFETNNSGILSLIITPIALPKGLTNFAKRIHINTEVQQNTDQSKLIYKDS